MLALRSLGGGLVLAGLVAAMSARAVPVGVGPLDWSDEFDGTALDSSRWQNTATGELWGNAYNMPAAVSVANGHLTITTYTSGGSHYTGMVSTQGLLAQAYGYFEQLTAPAGLAENTWHTYGLRWNPSGYTFYCDDVTQWSAAGPVSNVAQYLILSSEVQDQSRAGNIPTGGYGSLATSTSTVQVDYVRVYSLPEPAVTAPMLAGALAVHRRHARRSVAIG